IGVDSSVSLVRPCAPGAVPVVALLMCAVGSVFLYGADANGGVSVILARTPDAAGNNAPNYRLATAPTRATSRAEWPEWAPHRHGVLLEGFELFVGFTALAERSNALERIRLLKEEGEEYVAADEPAYSMGLSVNAEPGSEWLRYGYTSLTTPATTYELNVRTGERRLLKQQPVIGYDPSLYATERTWATARDGTRIPVSLVYRKGFAKDGTAPLLQYAYGSYGMSMDPGYSLTTTSLLDRGMVYAIAHIRGGQEMGR